ncbi:MAG TPA: SdrD B-like domain-containing protein, partial [Candidatus Saccharimonadales bacterium]|nr:SdrD B-like domain-containing protein [Candidatus Saccharimonadales bacterium]
MKQLLLPIWQSFVLLCSSIIFFIVIPPTAFAQLTPIQIYQANPKTYTYGSYANNRNPYDFEVYSCANPNDNYNTRHDTCEPTRTSIQGLYFWSNSVLDPNNGNTCSQVQNGGDGPDYTSDGRTMNGTGQPDSQLNMCPNGNGTPGPDFINVTKSFDYDSSYCANGEEVVLSPRSDPGKDVCQGLNVYTMDANPQNYSQDQRNCLMYVDDEAKVTACLNGKCSSTYIDSPVNPGPKGDNLIAQAGPTNICSVFNRGDGTYDVQVEAYDTGENMYGSSSFWLTWNTFGSTYNISGHVFDDINKNGKQDAGEPDYTGPITITSSDGSISTGGGSYTISNLQPGQVTVSFPNLPSGYLMSYPKNGPPPSFIATVGIGCSVNGTTGATCNAGNIQNLN